MADATQVDEITHPSIQTNGAQSEDAVSASNKLEVSSGRVSDEQFRTLQSMYEKSKEAQVALQQKYMKLLESHSELLEKYAGVLEKDDDDDASDEEDLHLDEILKSVRKTKQQEAPSIPEQPARDPTEGGTYDNMRNPDDSAQSLAAPEAISSEEKRLDSGVSKFAATKDKGSSDEGESDTFGPREQQPSQNDQNGPDATATPKTTAQKRIKFQETRYDKMGKIQTVDLSYENAHQAVTKDQNQDEEHAFIWRKEYDIDDKYKHTDVIIESKELRTLLGKLLSHHPSWPVHERTLELSSPFAAFIHNWSGLLKATDGVTGEESLEDTECGGKIAPDKATLELKLLMNQITTVPELQEFFQDYDANGHQTIEYGLLWTIFESGCVVFSQPFLGHPQAFVVQLAESSDDGKVFVVTCQSYDWNGETFTFEYYDFTIPEFTGPKSINTLNIYPLRYHQDSKTGKLDEVHLRETLVNRGKEFTRLCLTKPGSQTFTYDGDCIEEQKGVTRTSYDPDVRAKWYAKRENISNSGLQNKRERRTKPSKISGTVIVDFESYNRYVSIGGRLGGKSNAEPFSQCLCEQCLKNEGLMHTIRHKYNGAEDTTNFCDEQYLLCPPRTFGFYLPTKSWVQLWVDAVKIREPRVKAFNTLVLSDHYKNLIRSMVSRHGAGDENMKDLYSVKDIVEDKGMGVVILLHGPPGVGKSLTAESVSEIANKPLFSISVADIGLDPVDAEWNLRVLFNLAGKWGAALLFDEADVFLEARDSTDINRNALVSVLLRVMEYYQGILILTSNRVKAFDTAVQSRVHLAIRYTDLGYLERQKIFMNFYDQLNSDNCDELSAIKRYIDDFDEEFNGRQIRNLYSSAMALARQEDTRVRLKHFKDAVKVTKEFKKYLDEQTTRAKLRDQ